MRAGATVTHVHCKDMAAMWVTHLIAATSVRRHADVQGIHAPGDFRNDKPKNQNNDERLDNIMAPKRSTPDQPGDFAQVFNLDSKDQADAGKTSSPLANPVAERIKGKDAASLLRTSTSQVDCGTAACKEYCEFTNEHCDAEVHKCIGDAGSANVQTCAMGCTRSPTRPRPTSTTSSSPVANSQGAVDRRRDGHVQGPTSHAPGDEDVDKPSEQRTKGTDDEPWTSTGPTTSPESTRPGSTRPGANSPGPTSPGSTATQTKSGGEPPPSHRSTRACNSGSAHHDKGAPRRPGQVLKLPAPLAIPFAECIEDKCSASFPSTSTSQVFCGAAVCKEACECTKNDKEISKCSSDTACSEQNNHTEDGEAATSTQELLQRSYRSPPADTSTKTSASSSASPKRVPTSQFLDEVGPRLTFLLGMHDCWHVSESLRNEIAEEIAQVVCEAGRSC